MRLSLGDLAAQLRRMAEMAEGGVLRSAVEQGAQTLADGVRARLSEAPGGAHDAPWLQSGALRDSIGVAVDGDGLRAVVGTSDSAAVPQEMGTVHMPARPFLAPAAAELGEAVARAVGARIAAALRGEADDASPLVQDALAGMAPTGLEAVAPRRGPLAGATASRPKSGTVLARNNNSNSNIVKVSDGPPLQRLHPDSTYERDSGAKRSLDRARRMSTQDIIDSLRPGSGNTEALRDKPNGVIVNGNTRVKVL